MLQSLFTRTTAWIKCKFLLMGFLPMDIYRRLTCAARPPLDSKRQYPLPIASPNGQQPIPPPHPLTVFLRELCLIIPPETTDKKDPMNAVYQHTTSITPSCLLSILLSSRFSCVLSFVCFLPSRGTYWFGPCLV